MTHLGTQIAALVDGRLAPAAAERALGHVAGCADCAAEVAAQRATRTVLASAAQVPVAEDLAARLLALGQSPALLAYPAPASRPADRLRHGMDVFRSRMGPAPVPAAPLPASRTERLQARACLRDHDGRRMPGLTVLAAAGLVAAWLFAIGEEAAVVPQQHPAQALTLLAAAEALGATENPDVDPAAPATVPPGYEVVAVQRDGDVVEIDLDGPYGAVVVTHQPGRLDPDAVADAPVIEVGGHEARVLSRAPWHMVWQSGDTVVSVLAGGQSPAVEAVATLYPELPFDDGVDARIRRGWTVLAGNWTP